jgi:hypothetical protein
MYLFSTASVAGFVSPFIMSLEARVDVGVGIGLSGTVPMVEGCANNQAFLSIGVDTSFDPICDTTFTKDFAAINFCSSASRLNQFIAIATNAMCIY